MEINEMGKYTAMLRELEIGKTPRSAPYKTHLLNISGKSGGHLCVSENTKLAAIASETKTKPPVVKRNQCSATRVYHVILETNGAHKGMTIIDPSGDDLEDFKQSCYRRFGADRVISIEARRGRQK